VTAAVEEAHRRLKGGEHNLAVHPNCGTVLVTTAALATMAAQAILALDHWREPRGSHLKPTTLLNSLPGAMVAVVGALIVGRPLGLQLQERYTVDGDLRDLRIVSVSQTPPSIVTRLFHLLLTGNNHRLPPSSYFIQTTGGDS
jgi:hypothetical protein